MSKKNGAKRRGPKKRSRVAAARIAAALALCVVAAGVASTRWGPMRRGLGLAPASAPLAQATPQPLQLSKDYIYVGGRLVATEEPNGAPAAPGNLRIPNNRVMNPFKGSLAWNDNSGNETGFKIEKNGTGGWSQIALVGPNVTSYMIYGTCGDSYRVRATNALGDSAYSNIVSACAGTITTGPDNLVATAVTANSVSLIWTAPPGTIDHYEVERTSSLNEQFTLVSNSAATAFTDSNASADTAYLYRVRAVFTGGGASDYSNTDLAATVVFTDDPLIGANDPLGRPATRVYARHLTELRRAVDAVRVLALLGLGSWQSNPAPATGGSLLASHSLELRSNLSPALSALGLEQMPNDSTLAVGLPVRAVYIQDVREKVR